MISLPDLSAITSVTTLEKATSDSVIAGLSTGAYQSAPTTSPALALLNTGSGQALGPATLVDLSDHAKAVLEKAKADQTVADRLSSQIDAAKGKTSGFGKLNADKRTPDSIYDQIHDIGRELKPVADDGTPVAKASTKTLSGKPLWQQLGEADNIGILQAGAKLYNRAQAMQDLAKNGGQFASPTEGHVVSDDVIFVLTAHMAVASKITELQDRGLTDKADALSKALETGTLKFQKAEDVPDLNMTSWVVHFADAGGGGEMASSSVKPTGAVKAALDGGDAITLGMVDRGNFYVTW